MWLLANVSPSVESDLERDLNKIFAKKNTRPVLPCRSVGIVLHVLLHVGGKSKVALRGFCLRRRPCSLHFDSLSFNSSPVGDVYTSPHKAEDM